MIDLYYWPTPNGHKITIFLEETGLPYKIIPVNLGEGDQFKADFLKISPNNKMPAIVDRKPKGNQKPISLFESGAILLYLAEKTGLFLPEEIHQRFNVLQWLFWQVAGLGPMSGQNFHFLKFAPEKIPYAIERYSKEVNRLYAVLNKQLESQEYIAGKYSIADISAYPWMAIYQNQNQNIEDFQNLARWLQVVGEREAVKRAYAIGEEINPNQNAELNDKARKILFGQDANTKQ